ncbi:UDP-N-acetylmuramoyl-L-alanine--D-glutamate ligase [Candidatus Giovannonibacteria bacterium]|nr:UDP-N-acetylmuramoyl-L-alanine--D-glutamate ligase [Candidatus Giovannonibacteria bacterium]
MKVAILGYGVEGRSAEKFLKKEYPKANIEIRDAKIQGKDYLKGLTKFDIVVRSPGIKFFSPEIQRAIKKGVKISSSTKLFFSAIGGSASGGENARGTLIGITGTKGKGTTATILYEILSASRRSGHLAAKPPSGGNIHLIGNIGVPMLDELPKLKKNSISILELSSFQLQDLDVSPHIAAVLDILPDHLNYHRNFKEYIDAKINLVKNPLPRCQVFKDTHICLVANCSAPLIFYFPDNKYSSSIAKNGTGAKNPVSIDPDLELSLPGTHNLRNASMAAAIAHSLGVNDGIIKKVIKNFKGLPQHLEFIRSLNGIDYFNDSASTNPASTASAVMSFIAKPFVLIAGGADKGLDYVPLRLALKYNPPKLVILFGANKTKIKKSIGRGVPIKLAAGLEDALSLAMGVSAPGDTVIFSPGAASFDMFKDSKDRGEAFNKAVDTL